MTPNAPTSIENAPNLPPTPSPSATSSRDIYRDRGLSAQLAGQVADELSAIDRFSADARDELGIDTTALANPVQAAVVSAVSFVSGAIVPILVVLLSSATLRVPISIAVTLIGLVVLGALGARLGGAPVRRAGTRVLVGGTLALVISLAIGRLTGSVV